MPLRTNVLRRRPLAVTSPFTSYARASALRSEFVGASLKADCSQPYPPQAEPRRGGQGVGQSKGGGDGQRPAPGDICPGPCLSRRGPSVRGESGRRHACGGFILRGAGRRPLRTNVLRRRPLAVTSPFTSYARASARRSEFAGASLKGGRERCDLLAGSRASSGRAGPIGSRRIRTKTWVWRMHSARRRAETLAYECPPAPAVGRHLLLYFVRKGIRPALGVRRRFLERRPRVLRSPHRTPSLVGAGRGLGKVKEEVTANGRRRGTFAQTPARPGGALQPAETSHEDALRYRNDKQKKTRQREGSAGSGLRGGRDPRNECCVASVVVRVRR